MTTQTESLEKVDTSAQSLSALELLARIATVMLLLFVFLVGIKSLGSAFKLMGSDFAKALFSVSSTPVIGLFTGLLATTLIQSSSATTSIIVGLVSSGALGIASAVPMIMGANLGTSVTNTLVSLAYVKDRKNFKEAFSAATVHDIFNILTVAVLLPIELMTGVLQKSATYMATALYGSVSGMKFSSPVKAAIKPAAKALKGFVTGTLGLEANMAGMALAVIAGALIVVSLILVVKTMKAIVESNKGDIVEKLLTKNPYAAILFGAAVTVSVQSSSITTSLLVPMAGAGLLTLNSILPITIGANIGTTATALLAAMAGNVHGLTIALVHLLFNVAGALIWFPNKTLRQVPLRGAELLGEFSSRKRLIGVAYILGIFFLLPLGLIFI